MAKETFDLDKARVLHGKQDLSRKGSIDRPIADLVEYINSQDNYYTTSSCSGRILVFLESHDETKKKGCKWLLTSHEEVSLQQLQGSLKGLTGSLGYVYFKFEPFVLHVACKELPHAQSMLQHSVASGFRNSGISVSRKGRVILAVRSTHSLQVPIAFNGQVLISDEYLTHLVKIANQKMAENLHRIDRFYQQITNQSDKNEESTCSHSEDHHSGTLSQRQQQRTNSVLTETNDLCDDSLLDCVTDMFDQN